MDNNDRYMMEFIALASLLMLNIINAVYIEYKDDFNYITYTFVINIALIILWVTRGIWRKWFK